MVDAVFERARAADGKYYCAFCPKEIARTGEEAKASSRRGHIKSGFVCCHGWMENPPVDVPAGPTIYMNLWPGESVCNGGAHIDQWAEQAASGATLSVHAAELKKQHVAFMEWWEKEKYTALEPFGPDFPKDAKRVKQGERATRITMVSKKGRPVTQ
eukprot:COSAG01_NODE_1011_length_12147_cov_12.737384_7_plen_157_part_00